MSQIHLVEADGNGLTRLTDGPNRAGHPVWSPDSQYISFYRGLSRNFEIYVARADGFAVARLTHDPGLEDFAAWQS
jgi:TolB protein